ncbi:MAG TPA: S8 family serine peptidase [Longimicrobium sp.]|jgi:subtilisin family serine protease|uniref:S8 family serine peptidase n=1 Tax=Longimicrobium sp. TaxID=2029185 RepID=UPI002ED9FE8D
MNTQRSKRILWIQRVFAIAAAGLSTAACADQPALPDAMPVAEPAAQASPSPQAGRVIPDRYIVVLKDDEKDVPGFARRVTTEPGAAVHYTYEHVLKGFAVTLPPKAVEALRRNPRVKYIEPDGIAAFDLATQYGATWGLDRVDQLDRPLNGTYGYQSTGRGVNVYVIDSGIETAHAEFGGRARVGMDVNGGTGQDCHGHGTHVAGTIGGRVYGVAKAANLVAVRVSSCKDDLTRSGVVKAVEWVTLNYRRPAVVNMSLSFTYQWWIGDAVGEAVQNSIRAGVSYVVAAGNNDGADACERTPARVPDAITVGATTAGDARADFSNQGSCIDIFAPGVGIASAGLSGGMGVLKSGTSMAAPHVTGTVALYLERDPSATPGIVRDVLLKNSTVGRLTNLGTSLNTLVRTPLGIAVHRLFRASSGDHMYGPDPREALSLGYVLEGRNYFYLTPRTGTEYADLYRCLVPATGDHFLSTHSTCEGMVKEAMLGRIAKWQVAGTVPLYRLYNRSNGDHFYTISYTERQSAISSGWVSEGVTGYVFTKW